MWRKLIAICTVSYIWLLKCIFSKTCLFSVKGNGKPGYIWTVFTYRDLLFFRLRKRYNFWKGCCWYQQQNLILPTLSTYVQCQRTLLPTKGLISDVIFIWKSLNQLCPLSNPRAAYGPVEDFVRPILVFTVVKVSNILTACPLFDNLQFDIFDAGGPQCHFITSFTIAVRIPTLSIQ